MAKISATEWLTRWGNGLNGAGARIKAGVSRVTTAPGVSAAQKQDKMLQGVTQSITSGKWAQRVSSVPLSQWQDSMNNKGVANISSGVSQAQKNKTQAIQGMLDDNDAALAAIAGMPSDTFEQRMARATAFMQARRAIAQKS